jgi:hypothetical protein
MHERQNVVAKYSALVLFYVRGNDFDDGPRDDTIRWSLGDAAVDAGVDWLDAVDVQSRLGRAEQQRRPRTTCRCGICGD